MTRKRAVKLLMARGYSRNRANRIMQSKAPGDSNLRAYRTYLRCDSVCDTIGNHGYGRYRWTILSHKTKAEHYDGHGNIISATLSISLQEYLR